MILTKRNYLGEGYVHKMYNPKTQEYKYLPITKEEYEKLAVDTSHNPQKDGDWIWNCSIGGTLKVDTEDTMLDINEYVIFDNIYWVRELRGVIPMTVKYTEEEFKTKYPNN